MAKRQASRADLLRELESRDANWRREIAEYTKQRGEDLTIIDSLHQRMLVLRAAIKELA